MPPNESFFSKLKSRLQFTDKKFLLAVFIFAMALVAIPLSFLAIKNNKLSIQLSPPPQTYSVVTFNSKKDQAINLPATLTGKGIPNANVAITISPNGVSSIIKVNKDGLWTYSLPNNLKPKVYHLTLTYEDIKGSIAAIKSYRVILNSNNTPKKSQGLGFIKSAFAAGNIPGQNPCDPEDDQCVSGLKCQLFKTNIGQVRAGEYGCTADLSQSTQGPDFNIWQTQMRHLGIYPEWENGEIVFYNREAWDAKYCPNACIWAPEPPQEIINNYSHDDYLVDLAAKLMQNGYNPVPCLLSYFTELAEYPNYPSLEPTAYYRATATKTTIDEATLAQYIREVWNERGWARVNQEANFGDPLKTFITLSDPIFATRSIIAVVSLPPNQVTDETRFNAVLGLTMIYGFGEKVTVRGIRLGSDLAVNAGRMVEDVRGIRNAVRELRPGDRPISFQAVAGDAQENWLRSRPINFTELSPIFPSRYPSEGFNLMNLLRYSFSLGKAWALDPNSTRPMMWNLVTKLESLQGAGALKGVNINRQAIFEVIENSWVIAVEDAEYARLFPEIANYGAPAFAHGRTVVVKKSYIDDEFLLTHEFTHAIAALHQNRAGVVGKYFSYNLQQTDRYGQIMSALYELGTDDVAEYATGLPSRYKNNPCCKEIFESMNKLVNDMISRSNGRFTRVDLKEFALTADDGTLLRKIFGRENPQDMLDYIEGKVNFTRLERIFAGERQKADNIKAFIIGGSAGIGLPALGVIAVASSNPNITENNPVMVTPPIYNEDLDILTPEFESQTDDDQITINNISGDQQPGGTITVSLLEAKGGTTTDEFQEVFVLEPSSQSQADFIKSAYASVFPTNLSNLKNVLLCTEEYPQIYTCKISISENLGPHKLIVYAHAVGSETVLATTSWPVTITNGEPNPPIGDQPACPFFWQTKCPGTNQCINPGDSCPSNPNPVSTPTSTPQPQCKIGYEHFCPGQGCISITNSCNNVPNGGLITNTQKADLVVSSYGLNIQGGGNIALPGKSVTFSAMVKNQTDHCIQGASGVSNFGSTFTVLDSRNNQVFTAIGQTNIPICNGRGGEELTSSEGSTWVVSGPGPYTLRVCADARVHPYSAGGAIFELDENNNCSNFALNSAPVNIPQPARPLNDQSGIDTFPISATTSCVNGKPKVTLSFNTSGWPFVNIWRDNQAGASSNDSAVMLYLEGQGKNNGNINVSDPISLVDDQYTDTSNGAIFGYQKLPSTDNYLYTWMDTNFNNPTLKEDTNYFYSAIPNNGLGTLLAQGHVSIKTPICSAKTDNLSQINTPVNPTPTPYVVPTPQSCPFFQTFCPAANQCQLVFLPCQTQVVPSATPVIPTPTVQAPNYQKSGQPVTSTPVPQVTAIPIISSPIPTPVPSINTDCPFFTYFCNETASCQVIGSSCNQNITPTPPLAPIPTPTPIPTAFPPSATPVPATPTVIASPTLTSVNPSAIPTLTPAPNPTSIPTPTPNQVSCTGLSKYCSSTNQCESAFYPCPEAQNPTSTPRQKQLIRIVIKDVSQDIEIYPQNSSGVDLNLNSNTSYLMVITYLDENGVEQSTNRSLLFQRPAPSPTQSASPTVPVATPTPQPQPTQDCGSYLQKYCPRTNECISVFYDCP